MSAPNPRDRYRRQAEREQYGMTFDELTELKQIVACLPNTPDGIADFAWQWLERTWRVKRQSPPAYAASWWPPGEGSEPVIIRFDMPVRIPFPVPLIVNIGWSEQHRVAFYLVE